MDFTFVRSGTVVDDAEVASTPLRAVLAGELPTGARVRTKPFAMPCKARCTY